MPYFLVQPKDLELDGSAPTLLYGYGGFEVSLTPAYSGTVGEGWLEQGRRLRRRQHPRRRRVRPALAPGGAQAEPAQGLRGLRRGRAGPGRAQDHLAAAPGHQGGSNGGLLVGNMLTQYPELFGAVVVQVPLLDMKRYSHLLAGASWMAEYGDPDTADWEFIRTFSPYQLFDAGKDLSADLFIWTSTRDDRVHPGHARKMAAEDARRRTRTCATTRTSKAATAAAPTTRSRRTCGRWRTRSCGRSWAAR